MQVAEYLTLKCLKARQVLHVEYFAECRAVWEGVRQAADDAEHVCKAELHAPFQVSSLALLQEEHGPFDAVLCAAGAAGGMLPELGTA